MITLNDIHLRLCECIRESGYTQTHLAELLGISPATISHYLRGDKFPALDTLANLCRILDVSPAYILCSALTTKSISYEMCVCFPKDLSTTFTTPTSTLRPRRTSSL